LSEILKIKYARDFDLYSFNFELFHEITDFMGAIKALRLGKQVKSLDSGNTYVNLKYMFEVFSVNEIDEKNKKIDVELLVTDDEIDSGWLVTDYEIDEDGNFIED